MAKMYISNTSKAIEALFGVLDRTRQASWHHKLFHTVCLDGRHKYHVPWPTYGP